jgi:serine/threonine protein phosphatase PrpC
MVQQLLEPQWNRLKHQILVPLIQSILYKNPFGQSNGIRTALYGPGSDPAYQNIGLSSATLKNFNKSPENQDVTLIYITQNQKTKIGAVFDGHAPYGLYAAAIAAATLKIVLDENSTYFETQDAEFIKEIIVKTIIYPQMHKNINDGLCELFEGVADANGVIRNGEFEILGGTTCSIVISHVDVQNRPSTIYSYVGDSDIYKITPTRIERVSLYQHIPSNPVEKIPHDRIVVDGGYVIGDSGYRIQMTRSLGDSFMGTLQKHDKLLKKAPLQTFCREAIPKINC